MSVMQTVLKQFVLPFGIWTSKFTNKNDRSVFFYKLINYIIFIVFKILRLNDSKLERHALRMFSCFQKILVKLRYSVLIRTHASKQYVS